jgi:hypothetical protein
MRQAIFEEETIQVKKSFSNLIFEKIFLLEFDIKFR